MSVITLICFFVTFIDYSSPVAVPTEFNLKSMNTSIFHNNLSSFNTVPITNIDWEYVAAMVNVFDNDYRNLNKNFVTVLANIEESLRQAIKWGHTIISLTNSVGSLRDDVNKQQLSKNSTALFVYWADMEIKDFLEKNREALVQLPNVIYNTILVLITDTMGHLRGLNELLSVILPSFGWRGVHAKTVEIYNSSTLSLEQVLKIAKGDNEEVAVIVGRKIDLGMTSICYYYPLYIEYIQNQCFSLGAASSHVGQFKSIFETLRKLDEDEFSKLTPSIKEEIMEILNSSIDRLVEMREELFALLSQ